jgi:hypothetical protein
MSLSDWRFLLTDASQRRVQRLGTQATPIHEVEISIDCGMPEP